MSMLKLPEEIQVDIFVRLPVNSILPCRCVCKLLYSLLSKPDFIKNHLNRSIKFNNPRFMVEHLRHHKRKGRNSPKNRLIFSIDYESILSTSLTDSSRCICEGARVIDFPFEYEAGLTWMKLKGKFNETVCFKFLGSCDGLICLGISTCTSEYEEDEDHSLCIWNPATKEYKKISLPQCDYLDYKDRYGLLSKVDCFNVRYGFGYARNIDDYKVVRISDYEDTGSFKIEVYTLGSDSWSTVETPVPYSFSDIDINYGLLFKGALHWIGITKDDKSSSEVVVSFDVCNDRLMDLGFPEEAMTNPCGRLEERNLGVLGDCLCLAFIYGLAEVDLWVMQDYGVRGSWTKQFTLTQLSSAMLYAPRWLKPIWCLESGQILIDTNRSLILYDQKNEIVRSVSISGVARASSLEYYVESIVPLNSGTYVEKRERATNGDMNKPQIWTAAKVNVSAHWTDDMEKEFCELLVEQMVGGNAPNLFGNTAWALVQDKFNKKMRKNLSVLQIKNEYYMLRSRYQEITRFMSMGGLSWDPNEKNVVVDDKRVWDAYVKENPDEECYMTLSCPIYEDLCVLFGDLAATKSHVPVENNNVPNLPSKQALSVFNGGKEVGGSSNAGCNDWGKRTAPSTSKCGASKKAAIDISVSIDATGRNYVFATDLQNDPYSIPNCTKLVQSLEGVSIPSIMAALEKFQDAGWRQVFISLEPTLQKEWLKSIGS